MTDPLKTEADSARHFMAWLASLFLVVVGAKLWVVQLYGSPMWLWDQWYEVLRFFKPWVEGHATWHDYFAPFTEHRILLTRLLDISVIEINGRLEPLVQMVVNTFIHTGFVCLLAFWLWDFLGRKNGGLICCLLMPFFALPYAGENIIWAFDSQAYMQGLFSLMTIVWLGFSPPGNWRWWLGIIMAMLDLFTMASGLLTTLAVAGLAILRMIKLRRWEKQHLITLGVSLAIAGIGASLLVKAPEDEPLKAHTLTQFVSALMGNLMWPFFNAPFMVLFIVLPLLVLGAVYFRKAFSESRAAELLLALAGWSLLQSLALAYGRGNYGGDVPASRYMDKLNMLVIASLFAMILLGRFWLAGPRTGKFNLLPMLVWALVVFFGVGRISEIVVDQLLAPTRMMNLVAEERVGKFMATGDERDLLERPTVRPDPKVVMGILRDPNLQAIMPAASLPPASAQVRGRFNTTSDWLMRQAVWILYAGLGLAIVLVGLALIRSPLGLAWENLASFLMLAALLGGLGFAWSKSPIHRETVERELQIQLANYFNSQNMPARAAIHEQKAKDLVGK